MYLTKQIPHYSRIHTTQLLTVVNHRTIPFKIRGSFSNCRRYSNFATVPLLERPFKNKSKHNTARASRPFSTQKMLLTKSHPPNMYKDSVFFGYRPIVFSGKQDQKSKVIQCLRTERKTIPDDLVEDEVDRFYNKLGLDDYYFQMEPVSIIADHIEIIYAAKIAAHASHAKEELNIHVKNENEDLAIYLDSSPVTQPELDQSSAVEESISTRYLDPFKLTDPTAYRVESFTSVTNIDRTSTENSNIYTYFVTKCDFVDNPKKDASPDVPTDIASVSDKTFLEKASDNTIEMYQDVMNSVLTRFGPVVRLFDYQGRSEIRLVVGYRRGSIFQYFPSLSKLFRYYGLHSTRTYVEQFSNGVTIISYNFKPELFKNAAVTSINELFSQITREASLLYCLPSTDFQPLFVSEKLSIQEVTYAHCVRIFCEHVMNKLGPEYSSLSAILDHSNNIHAEILETIKRRLSTLAFTRTKIHDTIMQYPGLVHTLFEQFYLEHAINHNSTPHLHRAKSATSLADEASTYSITPMSATALMDLIQKTCTNEEDVSVMEMFVKFNTHLLKTNFFQTTKVALSFRFDPSFLDSTQYKDPLYAMIMSIGNEFRGFHLRFRDVARGGIRLIKSANPEAFGLNARGLFDENYNLAKTQMLKNKDIPEGGAKGVILLGKDCQDKPELAFMKYIDSIIDLLIVNKSQPLVDKLGKPEILFMGPDENTADLVNWATIHAHRRNAPWWKSFFTGKKPTMGGIPHDKYGMTSLSVRCYVEGIYKKLNITDPSKLTKVQTGGPDGDLGSNEIKLSNEKYIAVIDGSGVLYDPAGLDRTELLRLADERKTIDHFDAGKLSPEGYRVLVKDTNLKLPNGEIVRNGTIFRNTAHLRYKADTFVPCGGRPNAININNVEQLIDDHGRPAFKYLVEGANLFITQDAKSVLEKAGVIVIRDASANKGGVTSSSLEVLASLSFDDASFKENMCVHDGKVPTFYADYVNEVKRIIQRNANLEFEAIWKGHSENKIPYTSLSNHLSTEIVKLDHDIYNYEKLWADVGFRNAVLRASIPKTLQAKIGLEKMLERIPESYLRAIFSTYLASRFVYQHVVSSDPFAFFDYISTEMKMLKDA
ncbi:putative NAD-specific glutamate dehydrogenase [Schizosaccharomyces pombe]|uniref:Probable NAD-specific glutamate dehydrogenase n=1 Tax=Schizosaccharomyces pombe (strain 972 / ATCC 24843) TaxID=284812 RepID=GDH2_SCHPO|nr:putative NAD-dependent glutamate dehydrogenase Gdh2 [Schizosaccharomyces pombe]Q9USN5.1 RecName: Full=Probable NAD-specific glutamate dehydrogenase; Short=NAD-GDH [Schizosaccharomyces pombe 972h-]CAB58131.1 NAD-dependent glutamate dehydrogenase Gdh2 (predicted) [Schizosaccharomyces pombe]|eukprot:NP_588149.1 putative NAD-dependent glutamate dehydrogenase Gdh2 [Schizosaccharomyces pombe]